MGRKERRAVERKIKHLAKIKPKEVQMLIQEEYKRFVVDMRTNKEVLAPGDKVMLDINLLIEDPDWPKLKKEYKEYAVSHANEIFTVSEEIKQTGPYTLVSFVEDETDPKWLWFTGYVKKANDVCDSI